jgi:hypothetical protein
LDYFGARYFASAQGRFTSPDEIFADQSEGDPQSWNLYAYVRNPSTGQKMRRNLLYDIKRPEQMASLSDQNDDVELWP